MQSSGYLRNRPARASIGMNLHGNDLGGGDHLSLALAGLGEQDARAPGPAIACDNVQLIINARRRPIVDLGPHNGKRGRVIALQEARVRHARITQEIAAPALEKAQVIRMIDHAGEIGVFIIDTHPLPVASFGVKIRWAHIGPRHGVPHNRSTWRRHLPSSLYGWGKACHLAVDMNPSSDSPVSEAPAARPPLPVLSGRTVLQVIPELDAGGAERTVLEITEALREAGAHSLVATRGGRMARDLEALGGEVIAMNAKTKNPINLRSNARRLADLVGSRGVDLIHARSRAPAWSALWAARKTGIPLVTTYHGAYSGGSRAKILYNSVMARGERVIANSDWIAAHVRDVHGVDEDRLVTIPRGVDLMSFDPAQVPGERAGAIRKAWGLHPEDRRLVLLLPGRLTDWKGQRLAVSALARMSDEERAELVLVLMGDAQGRADYVDALQRDIVEAGLQGAVVMAPHGTDMPAAYLAADIVISASTRPEAFGRIVAEASAMSQPVIAPDHGGAREIVLDGETGTRFTPGDPQALAGAIRAIIGLGARARAGMGETGRAHITANFSKRRLQAATLAVYAELLGSD